MKTRDVADQYNLNQERFEYYLKDSSYKSQINDGAFRMTIDDRSAVDAIVEDYKKWEEHLVAKAASKAQEKADKKAALASMLITSGFSFDGYTISKYSGYISGDDAISVTRGMAIFGSGPNVKDKLMESLVIIRRNA